jgi:hypothetical protein
VILNALSKRPSRANAMKADGILRQMELPVEEGGFDVEPDRLSYAIAILACARCLDRVFGARMAEVNLEKMEARAKLDSQKRAEVSSAAPPTVSLDVECFNVVLTAISHCRQRDAPDRVIRIIQRMEKYAEMGDEPVRPNIRSWNGKLLPPNDLVVVLVLLCNSHFTLTRLTLAVLHALARASGSKEDKYFARKAESILERLATMHRAGVPNVKPNAFTYAGYVVNCLVLMLGRIVDVRKTNDYVVAACAHLLIPSI